MKLLPTALALAALFAGSVRAQQPPVVRVSVTPDTVLVGQFATLRVEVLVPTWFARPPVFPAFELANALTQLPPNSSRPMTARINGETWSGIGRNYRVYPLLGASYRLSGDVIDVAYANPGGQPVRMTVPVPDIVVRGTVPEGAESLEPYLAGKRLELTLEADGDLAALEAGGALVIEYAAQLEGMPAIFLPPLAPELEFDGVSVYADQPAVTDGATARRSENVTLVFNSGGEFTVPDFSLRYWNTATGSIETVTAAGFPLTVAGPPPTLPEAENPAPWPQTTMLATLAAVLAMLVVALRRFTPRLASWMRAAAARRRQSERFSFDTLQKALRAQDAQASYRALLAWLERLAPGMETRQFAGTFGDAALIKIIVDLGAGLYSGAAQNTDFAQLETALRAARKRCLAHARTKTDDAIPPLNP